MNEPVPPRPDLLHPVTAPEARPDGRPKATWTWYEAVGVYVLALFVGGFAALPVFESIRSEDLANVVASILVSAIILGALLLWLGRFHAGWRRVVGSPKRIWPELRAGLAFGLVLYPAIVFVVGVAFTLILQAVSGHAVDVPDQVGTRLSWIGIVLTVFYALVLAPVGEELFFRGILFRSIRDRHGFALGALASGLAFGLVHYVPAAWQNSILLMSVMVCTGIALAWLHDRRRNLLTNIVAHATFNVIGLLAILAFR
jgi:uncharacterized protein